MLNLMHLELWTVNRISIHSESLRVLENISEITKGKEKEENKGALPVSSVGVNRIRYNEIIK